MKKAQPIPKDYGSATPFIVVKGVAEFLEFLQQAFDAKERTRVPNEDGTIGHAEVWIGDSMLMMFDANPDWPPTTAFTILYVEDCEKVPQQALKAGATEVTPLSTNAWGDRGSRVRDPFGNLWWIQTHVEDLTEEEMMQRMGEQKYMEDMRISSETLDKALKQIGR
jgi:PhnB protein